MSKQEARITSRAATPTTGRAPALLLSLRADDGPVAGGLSTPGEPPVLAAALHEADQHEWSV